MIVTRKLAYFPLMLSCLHATADDCDQAALDWTNVKGEAEVYITGDENINSDASYQLFCHKHPDWAARDQAQDASKSSWIESVQAQDKLMVEKVVSRGKSNSLCGNPNADQEFQEVFPKLATFVAGKALKHSNKVINEKNWDAYVPSATLLVEGARLFELAGAGDSSGMLDQVRLMEEQLVNHMLDEIEKKHDFRYTLTQILEHLRSATLLGSEITIEEILAKYMQIMHFRINYRNDTFLEDAEWSVVQRNPDIRQVVEPNGKLIWQPMPTQLNINFTMPVDDGEVVKYVPEEFYETEMDIKILACEAEPRLEFQLVRLGPTAEEITVCDSEGVCMPLPGGESLHGINVANLSGHEEFVTKPMDSNPEVLAQTLFMPLTNLVPALGTPHQWIQSADLGTESDIQITFTHTPNSIPPALLMLLLGD